jgi:hypothetical protein
VKMEMQMQTRRPGPYQMRVLAQKLRMQRENKQFETGAELTWLSCRGAPRSLPVMYFLPLALLRWLGDDAMPTSEDGMSPTS